jgi:hypothetical protein
MTESKLPSQQGMLSVDIGLSSLVLMGFTRGSQYTNIDYIKNVITTLEVCVFSFTLFVRLTHALT